MNRRYIAFLGFCSLIVFGVLFTLLTGCGEVGNPPSPITQRPLNQTEAIQFIGDCRQICEDSALEFMGVEISTGGGRGGNDSRCLCYTEEVMFPE